MEQKTLEALKESIMHWEHFANGEREDDETIGPDDCALCDLFFDNRCAGCPIAENTGQEVCAGTPYRGAADWIHGSGDYDSSEFRAAAQKELDYLILLLPADRTNS